MRALDRAFFKKTIPLSAAKVRDNKQISKYRSELGHDLLKLDRMPAIRSVKDSEGREAKALLLKPDVNADGITSSFCFSVIFLIKNKSQLTEQGVELRCCQMLLHGVRSSQSWSRLSKSACYRIISN